MDNEADRRPGEARKSGRRGGGRPTIADVARLAGVGAITVSRALRDPSHVSQSLRDRISDAIAKLGYVPDSNARALASSRADVIGVLVPSLTNIVFADVLRGIYDELGSAQLQIQLGNTHYSVEEEERLVRMFLSQRPTALIVAGIDQNASTRLMLENAGCPIVQIMETTNDPIDMLVGFSQLEGGRTATTHLIQAGYRRIGFLGARMDPRSQRRLSGYVQAMTEAGLFDPELMVTTPQSSSVTLGSRLLHETLSRRPDLDAVFCNNDDLALGVLFACQHLGIDVPTRLGICGFNDLEMMSAAVPALTSISTPRYTIGRTAVSMIQARLAGHSDFTASVDLGFEAKPRASTGIGEFALDPDPALS
ncbi:MAG: transcriptional regulator [Cereibacter sphaeroides]|uniref:Transcriptional regulator n=1 Tax=Cereibacter sphaeroides TaxID=1063 RepID=A0A2W5U175_CERSP|nr:MAG: transcriptional regulator [Cereibacter sphaeroides]